MLVSNQNVYEHEKATLTGERTTETDAPTISLSAQCVGRHVGWLAVAERQSALINIALSPTKPMTSLLLKCACKPPPPTQCAMGQL